jgi:hypothetical protein
MWLTPDGERILQGAEARLFREALAVVVDMVREDYEGHQEFGAPPFDNLQPNQKLAVLADVGIALLQEDRPMPRLTAVREAAVAAVYEAVMIWVEMEIDQAAEGLESPTWRELISRPPAGNGGLRNFPMPSPRTSTNGTCWSPPWQMAYVGTRTGRIARA